jgi:hypothetical protein
MITKVTTDGTITNDSGYYVLRVVAEVQISKADAGEIQRQKIVDRFLDREEQEGRSYAEQRYDEEIMDAIRDGKYATSAIIAPTKLNVIGI